MNDLKKDNINLINIGACTILESFSYYRFDINDKDGWPNLKSGEQSILIKTAIVDYFLKQSVIS